MDSFYEKEHALMQAILRNTGLQALCDQMEQMLGSPVAIGDFYRDKLVWSAGFPRDDLDDQVNRYNHMTREVREKSFEQNFRRLQDKKPHILELPFMRMRRLICGIFYHDSLVAILEAPDLDSRFQELDWDFFKLCSDLLGLTLHNHWFPTEKALSHPYPMLWNHFQHYTDRKWNDEWEYCVELASIRSFQVLWLSQNQDGKMFADAMEELPVRSWALPFQDHILILVDRKLPELWEDMTALAAKHHVTVGASDVFSSLHSLDTEKEQARCALSAARRAHNAPGLYSYNEYRLFDMLEKAGAHLDLRQFEDTVLQTIRAHDAQHNTEYEKTLRTYLMNRQNPQETARQLFIHKNTVVYRVNRLKELFCIDFNNCSQITHLYCSFLISDLCANTPMAADSNRNETNRMTISE